MRNWSSAIHKKTPSVNFGFRIWDFGAFPKSETINPKYTEGVYFESGLLGFFKI